MEKVSLVVCIREVPKWISELCQVPNNPIIDNIYTIRETEIINGHLCVRLEEISNPPNRFFKDREPFFYARDFREIQQPMDISELIKESTHGPASH